ncbi:tRNA threonylcarbamoyladenosine biosynthesis protein RimN [Pasteurellaceae bacterium Macca]|nr:tRNA threonylcarbamoyladenosine biosynthesis protein RimN [Pasteurellaceae bacterium Macca]
MNTLNDIVEKLKQGKVVAYPTEAVFGLGCNPADAQAVSALLALKNRPEEKGLILVAPRREFFFPFVDCTRLDEKAWQQIEAVRENAVTWIVPALDTTPRYLRGQFDTIAIRICRLPAVQRLCEATGFALTSTSANLTTKPPCRNSDEVRQQFGVDFPVLDEPTGGKTNPSEIRDIFTQQIFRQG